MKRQWNQNKASSARASPGLQGCCAFGAVGAWARCVSAKRQALHHPSTASIHMDPIRPSTPLPVLSCPSLFLRVPPVRGTLVLSKCQSPVSLQSSPLVLARPVPPLPSCCCQCHLIPPVLLPPFRPDHRAAAREPPTASPREYHIISGVCCARHRVEPTEATIRTKSTGAPGDPPPGVIVLRPTPLALVPSSLIIWGSSSRPPSPTARRAYLTALET